MGGGTWNTDVYRAQTTHRQKTGQAAFQYTQQLKAKPVSQQKVHQVLDPKRKNTLGQHIRESRDSVDHPTSLAIAVIFDETGSMGRLPQVFQQKLAGLNDTLAKPRGNEKPCYVKDPQILFGAVGDTRTRDGVSPSLEVVPLQVSEFESDNRMDEHLRNIYLEGNGGGQNHEAYGLAIYFAARHTALDCLEKRNKKGYLFLVGDEFPWPTITREEVLRVIGDGLEADLAIEEVILDAQKLYEVFFIFPTEADHGSYAPIPEKWRKLLGDEHVLMLNDADAIAELVTLTLGLCEGVVTLSEGASDLVDAGFDPRKVHPVVEALEPLATLLSSNSPQPASKTHSSPTSSPTTRRL